MIKEIKKLNIEEKVKLFQELYSDITDHGKNGDVHLAHINEYERKLLIAHGGCGTVNDLLVRLQQLKQENLLYLTVQLHWHNDLEIYLRIK